MYTDTEQTIATIRAMRKQEETGYNTISCDYLSDLPPIAVDANCRSAMTNWCKQVAKYCEYGSESVSIAINILDRFVSTPTGRTTLFDRNQYQLAAMTALYTTVKIHEQEAMAPKLVASLSRGLHTEQAVEAMESKMLDAIRWRVNPPTAVSFVRSMMELVPDDLNIDRSVIELAQCQIETIANDYDFCTVPASSVALACTWNALEIVTRDATLAAEFGTAMGRNLTVEVSSVQKLRIAIDDVMNGSDVDILIPTMATAKKNYTQSATKAASNGGDVSSSPRTVTAASVAQQ